MTATEEQKSDVSSTHRELIAMRTKHAGNTRITTRISSLIGQLERLSEEHLPDHARRLRDAIARSMAELRQISAESSARPDAIAAEREGAA